MGSFYTPGSGNGSSSNSSSFVSRREIRANNPTGALHPVSVAKGYSSSSFDFEAMLIALRELFEHDRQVASHPDARRCGICYLHFMISELHYREEGFYVCANCERAIGKQTIPMLRQQQK